MADAINGERIGSKAPVLQRCRQALGRNLQENNAHAGVWSLRNGIILLAGIGVVLGTALTRSNPGGTSSRRR